MALNVALPISWLIAAFDLCKNHVADRVGVQFDCYNPESRGQTAVILKKIQPLGGYDGLSEMNAFVLRDVLLGHAQAVLGQIGQIKNKVSAWGSRELAAQVYRIWVGLSQFFQNFALQRAVQAHAFGLLGLFNKGSVA